MSRDEKRSSSREIAQLPIAIDHPDQGVGARQATPAPAPGGGGSRYVCCGFEFQKKTTTLKKIAAATEIRGFLSHEDRAIALIGAGKYSVSRAGVVSGKLGPLCQKSSPKGYLYVTLRDRGQRLYCLVHRLVARVFHGTAPADTVAFHKNGLKTDNRAMNLVWVTPIESAARVKALALLRPACGERHYSTILTVGQVRHIKMLLAAGILSKRDIERAFNVGRGVVTAIAAGKCWKHVA